MEKKTEPGCTSVFDDDRCELAAGHFGKHRSSRDKEGNIQAVSWTNGGLARVLREREKQAKKIEPGLAVAERKAKIAALVEECIYKPA